MSQKRTRQIEQRIDRIKQALLEIGAMRPGSLTRQYKDPQHHTGAYWQISYTPPDEEPHRIRPSGIGEGDSPPDCHPQTLQAFG